MQKFFASFIVSLLIAESFAATIFFTQVNRQKPVLLSDDGEDHVHVRAKRQFRFGGFGGPYGQSSALANANAFNQYSGPNGFGSSSALAGAQSFNSQGPLGGFGASAANSGSQGFNFGPGGFNANSAFSGSQTYDLPGGHRANIAYGQGFNVGPNGVPNFSNSNSITFTK